MTSEQETKSPDVLIVSAGVGAGHNQAAVAIADGIRRADAGISVETLDVLTLTPRWFNAYYQGGFKVAMTRLPRAYGWGFRLSNRPQGPKRGILEKRRLAREFRVLKRFTTHLLERNPRLVVNTHFLTPPAIGRLRREGRFDRPQFTVVTDIEVHRWWFCEEADHWFLPHPYSAGPLARWGIAPEKITVSGIPIHPKWTQPQDRQKILKDWNLPADKKIVILTGGTDFTVGPIQAVSRRIMEVCPQSAVVVLAGRNKKLLADLSAEPLAGKRLFPQGFTDRSQELVEVASLMVTKPGGITTAECLSKGCPMVLLKPVPGQEGGNADFLAREGAAVITRTPEEIVSATARLLGSPDELAKMGTAARGLYRPGTETIVQNVLKQLETTAHGGA